MGEEARALRVTPLALARLGRARAGAVIAVHPRSVNVRLDGGGADAWVSLHGPGPLPSPFGIARPAGMTAALAPGTPVAVERLGGRVAALRLGTTPRMSLEGAPVAATGLPAAASRPALSLVLGHPVPAGAAGLLPLVLALVRGDAGANGSGPVAGRLASALARRATPALVALADATVAHDVPGAVSAAAALLGLGPGLTPSGDDAVAGWVTGLRVFGGRSWAGLGHEVSRALVIAAGRLASPLGAALLVAALAGHVAEPVRAFVARPDRARLGGLLALGASSGADWLAGYLLVGYRLAGAPPR